MNNIVFQVFQFCAKYNADLTVYLDKVWNQADHNTLSRATPTTYEPTIGEPPRTVLEAIPFMFQYDDYWWNLAHMFNTLPINGQYVFPSGVAVKELSPTQRKEIDDAEIKLYLDAQDLAEQHRSDLKDLRKLRDKMESYGSKIEVMSDALNETNKKIKHAKKVEAKHRQNFNEIAQKTRDAIAKRTGNVYYGYYYYA